MYCLKFNDLYVLLILVFKFKLKVKNYCKINKSELIRNNLNIKWKLINIFSEFKVI